MFYRLLRTSLSLGSLAVISACGGGAGGADAQTAPAQLGAALPAMGDYIAITQAQVSLAESSRTGSITVMREGAALGESSVNYRFVAGTASAGDDFRGTQGTLSWASGERGGRSINFLVESDTVAEAAEDFHIELFDAIGQDKLGINDRVNVYITDTPCNATIPASIQFDTNLTEPCYRLGGVATVRGSAQLGISAGTTIVTEAGGGFTFTEGATLNSEGTALMPVTLKGAVNQPGQWDGILLQSVSALHRVSFTEVTNATNAIELVQGGFAMFDENLFSGNSGAGVMLPMSEAQTLGKQNTFINTPRGIELTGSSIDASQTIKLPAQSTHYVLGKGLVNKGTLELAAGTDLRIAADVPVIVLSTGAINAVGTAELPINIIGLEPQQGFWNGIQYVSARSTENRLEHVTIAHGGGDPARAGNIIVDGLDTQISMLQCAITHSAGFGIKYDSSAFQVDLQNVTFGQNHLGEQSL